MKNHIGKILPLVPALTALALNLLVLQPVEAQTFTLDTPLLAARWGQAATLLTNGLVLIAGGRIANDYVNSEWANTNICELYNPDTGSSTVTGPMNDSHFQGAAVMLTNNQVLIAGGENNGQYTIAGAELYDSSKGAWTATGSLQQEREAFASAMLPDGRAMAAGGFDNGSLEDLASVEIYTPNTGIWTNAATMNYSADSETATLLPNGKVLVAGGSYNSSAVTNAILYNPANNTWTNTGPLNVARAGHVATLLPNGQVLVVGGGDNSAEIYNPTTGIWTMVAPMNDWRWKPSATLLPNGQVLVLGGYPGQTSAELYNPTNNTWTYTSPLNVGRTAHTATLVAYGQVVVAGGDASDYIGPPIAAVETFNQSAVFGPYSYALNTTNLAWNTSGDTTWLVETTNTYNGDPAAAQSGSVTNSQTSTLTLTVTGPGVLTFFWSSIANDPNGGFSCEFDVDGNYADNFTGDTAWHQGGSYSIGPGQHTLSWTAYANSDTDPTQAAFLDQVSFSQPAIPPSPGMWTLTGALTNAPYQETATLLPNGQVIVCGGSDNNGNPTASVQLYDPATGKWTGTNAMNEARYSHTATLLNNGELLVVGGISDPSTFGLAKTVELFNPTNSTWTTTGPLHFLRYGHTSTLLANGKVLVAGGLATNGINFNVTNVYPAEIYDPATGIWTNTGSLNTGRDTHTATLLANGKLLVAGGNVPSRFLVTSSAELYDPTTGLWSGTGNMLDPLAYHTATLLPSGKVLVAGGESDIGTPGGFSYYPVLGTELYDPTTGTWLASGNMNATHAGHTATLLNNGLVLVAGTTLFYLTTNSAELYDPASGQWTTAAQMNYPRTQLTATLLPNGNVLAAGGLIATAELFDSVAATIITLVNPVKFPGGALQFGWTNAPGSTNIVLTTTNLATVATNWTVLGSGTETTAGHFQYSDTQAGGNVNRFYRVRSP